MAAASERGTKRKAEAGGAGEPDEIDLGSAMSPLSREQLEILIVRFIGMHDELGDVLLAEVSKPVDSSAVHRATVAALNSFVGDLPIGELVGVLREHATRASNYVEARSFRNARDVLQALTGPFVDWCSVNAGSMREEDGERAEVETFFGDLESAWEGAIRGSSEELSADKAAAATKLFELLAGWRGKLQKDFGPIFSDPLRVLKRTIVAAGGGPPGADAKRAKKK